MGNDQFSEQRWQQQPGAWPSPATAASAAPQKHSELGIVATVLALLSLLLCGGYWTLIFIFVGSIGGPNAQPMPRNSPVPMAAGLMGIGAGVLALIGTILGIIGVVMANRKKLFAWIGLAINGLLLLGCAGVFCLGFASLALRAGAR